MPAKKAVSSKTHFHIPKDPLRVKSEEIQARHAGRSQRSLKKVEVTNDMLYELLTDILEKQSILEQRLEQYMRGKPLN